MRCLCCKRATALAGHARLCLRCAADVADVRADREAGTILEPSAEFLARINRELEAVDADLADLYLDLYDFEREQGRAV